jgi:hypothetical protein
MVESTTTLLVGVVAFRLIANSTAAAGSRQPVQPVRPLPRAAGLALLCGAMLAPSLAGCNRLRQGAIEALLRQGHAAAIDCLQGERARSDGDELRCNDWSFVEERYLKANKTAEPSTP